MFQLHTTKLVGSMSSLNAKLCTGRLLIFSLERICALTFTRAYSTPVRTAYVLSVHFAYLRQIERSCYFGNYCC